MNSPYRISVSYITDSEVLKPQCAISDLANEANRRTKHEWYLHKKHKCDQNQNN